ncbi:hypothetical protein AAY473_031407 [Plecturocebus cupreus]
MCHHTWLIFILLAEIGFHHVDQAGLKLLTSGDPTMLASQSAEITGLWLLICNFLLKILALSPRLEYSSVILAHSNLRLLPCARTTAVRHHTQLIFCRDGVLSLSPGWSGTPELKRSSSSPSQSSLLHTEVPYRQACISQDSCLQLENEMEKDQIHKTKEYATQSGLAMLLTLISNSQAQEVLLSRPPKDKLAARYTPNAWLLQVTQQGFDPPGVKLGVGFTKEMGFHCVGQAGLKLLTSSDAPTLASQSAGIKTGRFPAEETRVAGATLLAGAALPSAEYTGRTGSAGPIPTRKTAIGSAED